MDWKQNFDRTTLMEGLRIYQNQLLGDIQNRGSLYQSTVYDPWTRSRQLVQADITDGNIDDIRCTCPPARRGGFCRHEAAFLFGIEHLPLEQTSSRTAGPAYEARQNPARTDMRPHTESADSSQRIPYPHPDPAAQSGPLSAFLEALDKGRTEDSEPAGPRASASASYNDRSAVKTQPAAKENTFLHPIHPDETSKTSVMKKPEADSSDASVQPASAADSAKHAAGPAEEKKTARPQAEKEARPDAQIHAAAGSLQALLDAVPENQLRAFLLKEARNSPDFRLRLELEFLKEIPEDLLASWYSALDTLLYARQDAGGIIAREQTAAFLEDLSAWLMTRLDVLLQHDHPAAAFELISYAMTALGDLHFEDPNLMPENLIRTLCGELARTMHQADLSLMDEIFTWTELTLSQRHLPAVVKKELLQLLDASFFQERYMAAKVKLLMQMLEEETASMQNSRFGSGTRNEIIRQLSALFSMTDQYPQEKTAFEKLAADSSILLDVQIQQAMDLKDLETARILLMESIRKTPHSTLETAIHLRRLYTLLHQEGQDEQALHTLRTLLTSNSHIIPADLQLLHELVDEEEFLGTMRSLHSTISSLTLAEVYAGLHLHEALMELIQEKKDILLLELYENQLEPDFSGAMIDLWLQEAAHKASSSMARDYSDAIYALKKAAVLPQGESQARQMALQLKEQYPHKRSLLYRLEESGLLDDPNSQSEDSEAEN